MNEHRLPLSRLTPSRIALCAAAAAILLPGVASALTAPSPLESLEETDREALERLSTYPGSLREAALRATAHVDVLVETQRIQEQSSADFQERIADLDRETQEQLWEVVREPGLLDELAGEGPRSGDQLDAIVARHPESLAPAIRALGANHATLLGNVLTIQHRANERFEILLQDLPDDATRQAFRDLLEQPELLSLLARRVHLAVRLGDSFREDPEATQRHLAALGEEVAARDARSRDEWVQSIADDPEAAEDLEASARAYAEENGYDYDELTEPEVRTRVEVVVHPYPFWFGYPLWYADVYLFPYGYWYPYPPHFGFYYHDHHHYVWFGFPSLHFMHWFFGGHHHRHYTHLSHGFDRHHHRHRYARSDFHGTLSGWTHWRDRDHRHGFWGRRGHRDTRWTSGGGDGGLFVSLFERARFGEDAHRSPPRRDRETRPRSRDGGSWERGGRDEGDRDRGRVAAPPRRGERDARPGARDGGRRDRVDRRERGDRGARVDRGDRAERGGRPERVERGSRPERAERGGRPERVERGSRPERAERGGRPERVERGSRPERAERGDRRGGGDGERVERRREVREVPRVARPDPRPERPQVRVRDFRPEARSNRGGPSMERRQRSPSPSGPERGFSSRGRDRGPSFDRGGPGGGSRGRAHPGGGQRGGGRGRR